MSTTSLPMPAGTCMRCGYEIYHGSTHMCPTAPCLTRVKIVRAHQAPQSTENAQ